jgi:hypothetical protein
MNGQPSQVPPSRKTCYLKIVVLVFTGLILSYILYRHSLARSIQTRIDAIHRAGFPATCAELNAWYIQPPAGENAADVYEQAFAHYNLWTNEGASFSAPVDANDRTKFVAPPMRKRDLLPIVGIAKLPPHHGPVTVEQQKLIAEYLSDNAESLKLLHQAASMKSCRYPADFTNLGSLFPHLNPPRQAARLLELEAILSMDQQQPQLAVESVVASLAVARSWDREPLLISYLVNVACEGISLDSLQRVLNRISLTDAQLAELFVAVQEQGKREAFQRAFVGERCLNTDGQQGIFANKAIIDQMISYNHHPLFLRLILTLYKSTGLLECDNIKYVDLMDRYVEATSCEPPDSIARFHAIDEDVRHLHVPRDLSSLFFSPFGPAAIKAGRCAALMRDAQTALAIERYRLANGKLPGQLSYLIPTFLPSVPSDPFDGKPLRYKTLAKGYVVYSVGDDREDNGGTERNSKGLSYVPGTDITFTVER